MKDLLLLHGALGAKSQLSELAGHLRSTYTVHTFNFEGHGDRFSAQPFSIDLFVQNLADYLDEHQLNDISIFGYSMGGYVALKLAVLQPGRILQIMTLGTKFKWNPSEAEKEVRMLNPEKIEQKVPAFAQMLHQLHTEQSWKINMQKTAQLMINLGNQPALSDEQFTRVTARCFIGVGDQDIMVTREETERVANLIPGAIFYLLPNTPHPIDKLDMKQVAETIRLHLQP